MTVHQQNAPQAPKTETDFAALISGKEVQGTKVFSETAEELGHISDVMIDPASGRLVYGVLQFGGFLGIGSDQHPIPFGRLRYDSQLGGYVTDLTKEQLEGAPRHAEDWRRDRDWQQRANAHYGVPPYWIVTSPN